MGKPITATATLAIVAYSYVRFSHPAQAEGDSERRQIDRAEAYCRRKGWTLDRSLKADRGVSAWKGKNALVGNLGKFLDRVEAGAIKPGSALIVESVDRISRQGIDEGYDLIKRILKKGIILVTLSPEREFDAGATKSLSRGALELQLILERAAEESDRKSDRLGAAWAAKRAARRRGEGQPSRRDGPVNGMTILTHNLPAWIEEKGGKLHLIPERAAVVRRIFRMAADGYGHKLTTARLIEEGEPSFTPSKKWHAAHIGSLLRDRRAVGDFQPHSRGVPEGDPIKGYFPAAVTENEWLRARAGAAQRRRRPGRVGNQFVNCFQHLVKNAIGGDTYFAQVRQPGRRGGAQRVLVNGDCNAGRAGLRSFPFATFERAILSCLREIDPREILGRDERPNEEALLTTELAGVEAELSEAASWMDSHGFSPTIGKRVAVLEARKRELTSRLTDARARSACPAVEAWGEAKSLMSALDAAPDPRDARLRLRATLRRIVDEIRLLVIARGHDRIATAQVFFNGGSVRSYIILHRPPRSNGRASKPGGWWCRNFADVSPKADSLDLRKPADAAKLIKELDAIDLTCNEECTS